MSKNNLEPVEIRGSSGLIKSLGLVDVFVFNVIAFALGASFAAIPPLVGGSYPNANIQYVLLFGVVLALFNGFTYGMFAASMPRSGGDYIYNSRVLSPIIGFAANWGFTFSQLFGIGVYAVWAFMFGLIPALSIFGQASDSGLAIDLAKTLSTPMAKWILGTLTLATVFISSVSGNRVISLVLKTLFIVALLGSFVLVATLFLSDHTTFTTRFDAYCQSVGSTATYSGVVQGYKSDSSLSVLASSFWALPYGYLAFIGFTYSAYVGGEVKSPEKNQIIGIIGALLFGYLFFAFGMQKYYDIVGTDFHNSVFGSSEIAALIIPEPSITLFACILTENQIAQFLICLSSFLWFFLLPFVMTQVCIRNVFAWAYDGVIPIDTNKNRTSGGEHWPVSLAVLLVAELLLSAYVFLEFDFVNYVAAFSICFFITGIAAMLFPLKKHLFDKAPRMVKKRFLGIPLICIAGFGNAVLFACVFFASVTDPALTTGSSLKTFLFLGFSYGLGFLIYLFLPRHKKGNELAMIFKSLPDD